MPSQCSGNRLPGGSSAASEPAAGPTRQADSGTSGRPGHRGSGLAAAIASIAVFGLGVGQFAPLLSLLLEVRGTDALLNGLNASAVSVGIILGPWLAPRGVRALGVSRFLLLCLGLDVVTVLALRPLDTLPDWFALRFLLGLIGSNIFTASEAWINHLAGDAARGRILGLYVAILSAGLGLGPLVLALTGVHGWLPFVVNAGISALAALPLLAARGSALDLPIGPAGSMRSAFANAPLLLLAVALYGLFEMAMMTLLPVWGMRNGLDPRHAAGTLSGVYLGAIAMQVPVGWLSDRLTRTAALRLCGAVGVAGAAALIWLPLSGVWLFAVLFVWGGIAAGIYPITLSMAGDRFPPEQLVAVNAAVISAYGLGSLAGPVLGGAAMDAWNPQGLPALFVLLFGLFLLLTRLRLRAQA